MGQKISDLTEETSISGSESLVIVKGGVTKKATVNAVLATAMPVFRVYRSAAFNGGAGDHIIPFDTVDAMTSGCTLASSEVEVSEGGLYWVHAAAVGVNLTASNHFTRLALYVDSGVYQYGPLTPLGTCGKVGCQTSAIISLAANQKLSVSVYANSGTPALDVGPSLLYFTGCRIR